MDNSLIHVEGLYKIFGPSPTKVMAHARGEKDKETLLKETGHTLGLRNINLSINRGEIFVVMGLSGSGKSTLIRHFNRLIDPTEGRIVIDGTDVMSLSRKELEAFRKQKMSMVFQHFALMPHQTVLENIAYGLKIRGTPRRTRLAKAKEWLETVGLTGYGQHYPSQLSGGQQQRVGLARALCTDAEILLMDEAFSALDPMIRSEMQDQLISLQENLHKTIIFITHDLDEALRLGNRIAILKDGELIQVGAPEEILLYPKNSYVEAFVQNVNRARALTAETVMKPASQRISAATVGAALEQMRKLPEDYGYYVTENGFQGVVSQQKLETAANDDPKQKVDGEVFVDVPPVQPGAELESVIPLAIDSEFPLPVVDDEGVLKGQVSKETMINALNVPKSGDDDARVAEQNSP